jgi:hypothetical protein
VTEKPDGPSEIGIQLAGLAQIARGLIGDVAVLAAVIRCRALTLEEQEAVDRVLDSVDDLDAHLARIGEFLPPAS